MNVFNLNKNITKELENIAAYRKRLQQCSVSIDQLSTEKEREINIRIKEIQSEILGPTSLTLMKIQKQLLNSKTKNVVPEGKTLDCFDAQIRNEVSSRLEGLDSKISQIEHDIQEAQAVVPSFKKAQTIPELQQQYANALAELLTYQQPLTSNSKQYKQTAKLVESLKSACKTIDDKAKTYEINEEKMQEYVTKAEYFILAIRLIKKGYADAHGWVVGRGKDGNIKNAWFLLKVHEALSTTCMLDLIKLKNMAQQDNGIELLEQFLKNARDQIQIANREQQEKQASINAASQSSDTPAGVLPFTKAETIPELQKQYADIQKELSAYQQTLTPRSRQTNQTTKLVKSLDSACKEVEKGATKSYKIDCKSMQSYVRRAEYFALAVQLIKRGYTGAYSWVGELDKHHIIHNAWVLLDVHDRLPKNGISGHKELRSRAQQADGAKQLREYLLAKSEPPTVSPEAYQYSQALFFSEKKSSTLGSEKTKGDDHGAQSHHPMSLYKIN